MEPHISDFSSLSWPKNYYRDPVIVIQSHSHVQLRPHAAYHDPDLDLNTCVYVLSR